MKKNKEFLGVRELKKIASLFDEIEQSEKTVLGLLYKTAKAYYEAGGILLSAINRWNPKDGKLTVKAIARRYGFAEKRIVISLKIFKGFENNPVALKSLDLREALKLIAPPPPAGEEGYNRIDLGGDPGQMNFDFSGLFDLPATGNLALQNYRTVGDLVNEIIVVWRTKDNLFTSRRFVQFHEDIPRDPELRSAFKKFSMITQAALEDYLALKEQQEESR